MREVTVAAIQMRCSRNVKENIEKESDLITKAAENGAQIILPSELFERQYFCQERRYEYYAYAKSVQENDAVQHFTQTAKELGVVIIVSFYEKNKMCCIIQLRLLMLMEAILEYTERHIFQMTITIRRNSILRRVIQDLRCLIQGLAI